MMIETVIPGSKDARKASETALDEVFRQLLIRNLERFDFPDDCWALMRQRLLGEAERLTRAPPPRER